MTRSTFRLSARIALMAGAAALLGAAAVHAQAPVLDPRDTQGYHEGSAQTPAGRPPPAQVWNPSSRSGEPIAVPRSSQRELQQYYEAQDAQRGRRFFDRQDRRDRRERRRRD